MRVTQIGVEVEKAHSVLQKKIQESPWYSTHSTVYLGKGIGSTMETKERSVVARSWGEEG